MATARTETYVDERQIDDRYTKLIAYCRGSVALSPADLERVERIKLLLVARGIETDDDAAADWLAPALCTNAEEQKHFHKRFEEYRRRRSEVPVHKEEAKAAVAARPALLSAFLRREAALFGGIPMAILGLILAGYLIPWPSGEDPTSNGSTAGTAVGKKIGPLETQLEPNGPAIAILVVAAVAALTLFLGMRRRREGLLENFEPAPRKSASAVLAENTALLFSAPWLARTFGMLRRHKETPSRRVDARRSIRATVRAAGRPEIRFGSRPATPEYLLLVDRQSPRDHLLVVGDALQQHFAKENIVASRYDHVGKPNRLRPVPATDARPVALADATALHEGARVIALAEARDCASEDAGASPWRTMFDQLDQPTLLDPRRPRRWTALERQLEDSGVLIVPATPEGLGWYAQAVNLRGLKWPGRWPASNSFEEDPVEAFLADRKLLLDDRPPAPEYIAELLVDLRHSLGDSAFRLLSAAAVYPAVDPAFTLHLAANLPAPDGGSLLTEASWLAVARLPWMRLGHMPPWLRAELIRCLDPETLGAASALAHAFVLPKTAADGLDKPDVANAWDEQERVKLLNWIGRNPESELYDPLLFDALRGVPPAAIGAGAPGKPGPVLSIWRGQDALVAAALAAALAALAWTNPPLIEVPVHDPVAAPDENVSVPATDTMQPFDNISEPLANTSEPVTNTFEPGEGVDSGNIAAPTNTSGGSGEVNSEEKGPESVDSQDPTPRGPQEPLPGPYVIFFDWNEPSLSRQAGNVIATIVAQYRRIAATRPVALLLSCHSGSEPDAGEKLARSRCDQVSRALKRTRVPSKAISIYVADEGGDNLPVEMAEGVRNPAARRVEVSFFDPTENGK